MRKEPFADYDAEADVLYVSLLDATVEDTVELDDLRIVDYTSDGRAVGIEFISPSAGVDLRGLPFARAVEQALGNSGLQFKVFV